MMDYLFKNNYTTINTKEFYQWYKGEIEFYGKTLMIVFDDGNYEDYYIAYPILKKYNFKATSFIVGSRIKKISDAYNKNKIGFIGLDIINKVTKEYPNFEFQSHSYNMHRKINNTAKVFLMNNKEIELDFKLNSKFNFSSIAYPYGHYNIFMKNLLIKKLNYSLAFTFGISKYASRRSERYAIPRIEITGNADLNSLKKWLI